MRTLRLVSSLAFLPLMLTVPAAPYAQTAALPQADYDDRVADQEGAVFGRLRHVEGELTLRRDDELRADLYINDPVTPGDVLSTGPDGRAELQLADGSIVRLDFDTQLILQSLSDSSNQIENTTILQLASGSIIIYANEMDSSQKRFQSDTDSASVFLLSDGRFRIDARPDGTTHVSSRRGAAEVMASEVSSIVRSGERTTVRPGRIPSDSQVFNTRLGDDFDGWSTERDDAFVRPAQVDDQTPAGLPDPVDPYVGELSHYGRWYQNPSYGWVWRPVGLVSDWQPYLYGRWVSAPTGLVWVSDEPWGWAPFHYGRWEFLVGNGWVWIPGQVFSGAHVAWGISPGGYLGWCARGYYDYPVAYSFGYHRDPWVYVQVNNLFVTNIHKVYVKDVHHIKDIEKGRVVVRGRPAITPRRIKESPRIAEELYRKAAGRRDVQEADQVPTTARRMPFREKERQRQVDMNDRKVKGVDLKEGTPVGRGTTGRPTTIIPSEPRVKVPAVRKASEPSKVVPRGNPRVRVDTGAEKVIPRIIPRTRPEQPKATNKPSTAPPKQVRPTTPPKSSQPSGKPQGEPGQS